MKIDPTTPEQFRDQVWMQQLSIELQMMDNREQSGERLKASEILITRTLTRDNYRRECEYLLQYLRDKWKEDT